MGHELGDEHERNVQRRERFYRIEKRIGELGHVERGGYGIDVQRSVELKRERIGEMERRKSERYEFHVEGRRGIQGRFERVEAFGV